MLHIYRQITGLKQCTPVVIAQKRENAARYRFESLRIIPSRERIFSGGFGFDNCVVSRGRYRTPK